jgi:hypothetical protein
VYEKEDPNFKGSSKTHRDTKNRTLLSFDRNPGQTMTTSMLTFKAPDEFCKAQYARKPIVRDTFYRKMNVFFTDGNSVATGNN